MVLPPTEWVGGRRIRRLRVLALLVFFIMFFEHMSFEVSVRLNVQQLHCVENQMSGYSPADWAVCTLPHSVSVLSISAEVPSLCEVFNGRDTLSFSAKGRDPLFG